MTGSDNNTRKCLKIKTDLFYFSQHFETNRIIFKTTYCKTNINVSHVNKR